MGLDSLLQENLCPILSTTMKVTLVLVSLLGASMGYSLQHATSGSEVSGRQFSEEPVINYAAWGLIAGLTDYFVRTALNPVATVATTTTVAPTTTTTTTTAPTVAPAGPRKKNKKHNKERKQKKAQRKA